MNVKLPILSAIAATALSIGAALPAFAGPGVLAGLEPGARINVRSEPSTRSASPHYGLVGDRIEILNQTQGYDGYTWYYVSFRSGARGWVRGDYVRPIDRRSDGPAFPRESTVATFNTNTYSVKVYKQRGNLYMDVFNKLKGYSVLNREPAAVDSFGRGTSYYNLRGEYLYKVMALPNGRYTLTVSYNDRVITRERGYQYW
ncbi:MAG: SH3 domain-containing protein [Kovacikia sp.]